MSRLPHLDWIQYTVKEYYTEDMLLSCKESAFYSLPKFLQDDILSYCDSCSELSVKSLPGVNFYRAGFSFLNCVRVYFDPIDIKMGYNVIISGDVLASCNYTDQDIADWYATNSEYITLSRLDIAYDTDVDFAQFYSKFEAGEYVTQLRDMRQCVDTDHRGTLYFGKRSGRIMFRIYDKKKEQIDNVKGKRRKDELRKSLPIWTRIEGQFRHDAALSALINYLAGNIGNIFLGHLRFVKTLEGVKNKSRDSVVWDVYRDIIGGKCIMKIKKSKNEYFNVEYFERNVLSQVKAVMLINPELCASLLEIAMPSKSTMERLQKDELLLKREQRRLIDHGQVHTQQLRMEGL